MPQCGHDSVTATATTTDAFPGTVQCYQTAFRPSVLALGQQRSEDDADDRLLRLAERLEVDVDVLVAGQTPTADDSRQTAATATSQSTRTHSSDATRSDSLDSYASRSSVLSSNQSGTSHISIQQRSSTSLSIRDYDSVVSRRALAQTSSSLLHISPSVTPMHRAPSPSCDSTLSASTKRNKVKSGLRMLRRNRMQAMSSGCSHCRRGSISLMRTVHKLPCGHKLCTPALRDTITMVSENTRTGFPSCCGVLIPGHLLERVMTPEEKTVLMRKLEVSASVESQAILPHCIEQTIDTTTRPSTRSPTVSGVFEDAEESSPAPEIVKDLEAISASPDFRVLHAEQAETKDLFLRWIDCLRSELDARHAKLRAELKILRESTLEELLETHTSTMAEAEDKQVKAESDMRSSHAQERRDHATGLKHMEAYCAGTFSNGEAHGRMVTDQDRAELDKARHVRDGMTAKHAAAINVLRGEQARRMKSRAQRRDLEIQKQSQAYRHDELMLEQTCNAESRMLDQVVAEKRRKILLRWRLQMAVFARELELERGASVRGRLPSVDWQEHESGEESQTSAGLAEAA